LMLLFRIFVAFAALGIHSMVHAQTQQIQFALVSRPLIEQRLGQFAGNDSARERVLKQMFADAGCPDLTEQPVKGLKQANVICVMKGSTDDVIVVGAHFDHVDRGSGVVDNWSGASLLPSLLESLKNQPHRHTYVFIGFAGEEQGELGSEFYVKSLTRDQKNKLQAMVNMDTLGLGPSEVWASHADPMLVRALAQTAKALNVPLSAMNVENVGSTDSEAFRNKKIPAVTIHSLTQSTLPILHSPRDRISEVKLDHYYETYQLIVGFLVHLDQVWPPAHS